MKVEIWSDVVCPWCYVGKRRLEKAVEAFPHPVEVVWKSFQLDPTATTSPAGTHAAHLSEKYGMSLSEAQGRLDDMTAMAAAEGLDFHFDTARSGNTFAAHQLLHLAAEQGLQNDLKERFVRAYFTEGEPIDDAETLIRMSAEVGLDADDARSALKEDRFADAVRADVNEARELGISGVPFFVLDRRYGVSGAQPTEVLLQALEQAWSSQAPLAMVTADGEACDGDSCVV